MRFFTPKTFGLLAMAGLAAAALSTAVWAQHGPAADFDFAAVDTNKDGAVTPAEWDAYRLAQITAMDSDKNGTISPEELVAHHTARQRQAMQARVEKHAQQMIAAWDADKDGAVSIAEIRDQMPQNDRLFQRVDSDEDGAISQAEAQEALAKMAHHGKNRGAHGGHGTGMRGFW